MSARPYSYFHWLDIQNDAFRAGAFYQDGNLMIPSYIYLRGLTERAADEWKKRGFVWDKFERAWVRSIPAHAAQDQIAKANQMMRAIYGVSFGEEQAK